MFSTSKERTNKMDTEIAIADLVKMKFDEAFNEGNCYGFYDWFCKDSSLKNKAKTLLSRMKGLLGSGRFDSKNCYVFFKNNLPGFGSMYDDFHICDIGTGDVLYVVTPSGRTRKAEVWGVDNGFEKAILKGTWAEIRAWFLDFK
jgi:hypothetical protein